MAHIHKIMLTVYCWAEDATGVKNGLNHWFEETDYPLTGLTLVDLPATPTESSLANESLRNADPYHPYRDETHKVVEKALGYGVDDNRINNALDNLYDVNTEDCKSRLEKLEDAVKCIDGPNVGLNNAIDDLRIVIAVREAAG